MCNNSLSHIDLTFYVYMYVCILNSVQLRSIMFVGDFERTAHHQGFYFYMFFFVNRFFSLSIYFTHFSRLSILIVYFYYTKGYKIHVLTYSIYNSFICSLNRFISLLFKFVSCICLC